VSTSGFHAWSKRPMSPRKTDNERLLTHIREYHAASDGVMGMPRMHELPTRARRRAATGSRG
jgi:putative transposase